VLAKLRIIGRGRGQVPKILSLENELQAAFWNGPFAVNGTLDGLGYLGYSVEILNLACMG
jgi:hypothetical protein